MRYDTFKTNINKQYSWNIEIKNVLIKIINKKTKEKIRVEKIDIIYIFKICYKYKSFLNRINNLLH